MMGLRRVHDGFATHSVSLRLFGEDFCLVKMYCMFKISHDVTPARTFRTRAKVSSQFRD